MALKLSTDLKNYVINQGIVQQMCGTTGLAGTCVFKIYTGPQPADADTAPAGSNSTMLCQIINIGWGGTNGTIGATSGTAALGSVGGYTGTAVLAGTAAWARMETFGTNQHGSAGTFRIDGDVGTSSTCTFVINNVVIAADQSVSLISAPIQI